MNTVLTLFPGATLADGGTAAAWHTPVGTFGGGRILLNGRVVRPHLSLAQLGVPRGAVLVARRRPRLRLPGGAQTLEEFLKGKDPATTTVIRVPKDTTGKAGGGGIYLRC